MVASREFSAWTIRLQRGDCVLELLPNISWNKGNAVRRIEADVARRQGMTGRPVYLDDDQTDEHAFDAIVTHGTTVAVGQRPSRAGRRLPNPASVEELLVRLVVATRSR